VIFIRLADGVHIVCADKGTLQIQVCGSTISLTGLNGHEHTLAELQVGPVRCDQLSARWRAAELATAIRRMAERSLLEFDCMVGDATIMAAIPVAGSTPARFGSAVADGRYLLSRFAYIHRSGQSLLLESGRSRWRITVLDATLLPVIGALMRNVSFMDILTKCPHLPMDSVRECLRFLIGLGIVEELKEDEEPEEDRTAELAQREFHDVLLHAESRHGLASQVIGGVFPFVGKFMPTPAIKDQVGDITVKLFRPDLESLARADMSLSRAMETRRSIRRFAARCLTEKELGEFLFRVGRADALRRPPRGDPHGYETTVRTYPSGGAAYDIELYITAWRCEGLQRAVYHYHPLEHKLSLVTSRQVTVARIVRDAQRSAAHSDPPQVVVTLASRFSRLSWKYRGIAYAITLKNVGVLYEAMYLVATAMGLAPCALGGGDATLFSEATGQDPLTESSVGEFILGVPLESDRPTFASK
jgi:oxazoline/thiazoline dehydrogenase